MYKYFKKPVTLSYEPKDTMNKLAAIERRRFNIWFNYVAENTSITPEQLEEIKNMSCDELYEELRESLNVLNIEWMETINELEDKGII